MKRRGMVLLALIAGLCLGGLFLSGNADAASKIKIDKKHFPGKIFREYVRGFDTNKDGYLSKKERDAVKRIEVDNGKLPSDERLGVASVVNMKGLEHFAQVEVIWIYGHKLKNLKFDSLKNLELVHVSRCIKVDGKKSDKKFDFRKNTKLKVVSLAEIGSEVDKILFAKDNGIKQFSLEVPDKLKEVDLSSLSKVENLSITGGAALESIDLGKCPLLKRAFITDNKKLTDLDCSGNPDLEELWGSDNHLVSLDISKNIKLREMNIWSNCLSKLDVSQNVKLQNLNCGFNFFETMDISMLKNLRIFECAGCRMKELNFKGNPGLEYLKCQYNHLETLDLSENKKLRTIKCGGNPIETLDISGLPELERLDCEYARLSSLDISKNEKLTAVIWRGNCIKSVAGIENLLGTETEIIENEQKTQLLPPADGTVDEGVPIDKGHFPDYALRYEVLADFDTNHDGVLSEKESLARQPLKLKKFGASSRREIDCTGMEYLKGITEVISGSDTTLLNNTYKK